MSQTKYHALFGVKFLLAMAVFYFASGLVGRGEGTAWIRANRAKWLTVTLLLAVAIVMLSGWMRGLHVGPNRLADDGADGVQLTFSDDSQTESVEGVTDADAAAEDVGAEPAADAETEEEPAAQE